MFSSSYSYKKGKKRAPPSPPDRLSPLFLEVRDLTGEERPAAEALAA